MQLEADTATADPVDLPISRPPPARTSRAPERWLTAAVLLSTPLALVLQMPSVLGFRHFALEDVGTTHHAVALVAAGLRPMVDFGYPYGLLNLALGRLWFALFGTSPMAFFVLLLLLNAGIGAGLVRVARAMPHRRFALLVAAGAGAHVMASLGLVYALEAALLAQCVGAVAAGRRGEALAWATAGLFAKPSMAYVVGLLLVLLIGRDAVASVRRSGLRAAVARVGRTILPAAVVLVTLGGLLGLLYGPVPLLRTVFPVAGLALYKAYGRGNVVPAFAAPLRDGQWTYVFGSNFVPYVVLSACLAVLVPALTWAVLRRLGPRRAAVAEAGWIAAVAMVAFELKFFGGIHYAGLLVTAGLAAVVAVPVLDRRAVRVGLAGLLLLTWPCAVAEGVKGHFVERRTDGGFGLWASPSENAEWAHARDLAKSLAGPGSRPLVLTGAGAIGGLAPDLAAPSTVYLQPGIALDQEWARVGDEMAAATVAIHPVDGIFTVFHEGIRGRLDGMVPAYEGRHFRVLVRTPSGRAPTTRATNPPAIE